MRSSRVLKSLVFFFVLVLTACQEQEEVDRIYSSYLDVALVSFQRNLDELREGVEEGQYQEGTRSTMQGWLDQVSNLRLSTNSQLVIDSLFRVSRVMEDSLASYLNPYFSIFWWKLEQANTLYDYSKFEPDYDLECAYYKDFVDSLYDLNTEVITQEGLNNLQRQLDNETTEFVSKFGDGIAIPLINSSFEAPYDSTILGWQEMDSPYEWSPSIGISTEGDSSLPVGTVESGRQVLRIGSYTGAAVQPLRIGLFPTLITTISFQASLDMSEDNWQGRAFDTLVRSALTLNDSINGKTILGERFHSLGFEKDFDDFLDFQHRLGPFENSVALGEELTLEFVTREAPFFIEEWSETSVFLDQIKVKFSIN